MTLDGKGNNMCKTNRLGIVLCIGMLSLATGCGGGQTAASKVSDQTTGVQEVLQQGMAEAETEGVSQSNADASDDGKEDGTESLSAADGETSQNPDSAEAVGDSEQTELGTTEGIDVDLTTLSSTMVYSEVSNMMVNPDQYMGKTVKMSGTMSVYHDTDNGQDYYACVIADATACCSQGIEFETTDKLYPPEGSEVTVTGVFDTYEENGYQYCTLRGAELIK